MTDKVKFHELAVLKRAENKYKVSELITIAGISAGLLGLISCLREIIGLAVYGYYIATNYCIAAGIAIAIIIGMMLIRMCMKDAFLNILEQHYSPAETFDKAVYDAELLSLYREDFKAHRYLFEVNKL